MFHPRSRHIIVVWFDIFLTIKSLHRKEVKGETLCQQCGTTLQLTCLEEPTPKRSSFNRCCHHTIIRQWDTFEGKSFIFSSRPTFDMCYARRLTTEAHVRGECAHVARTPLDLHSEKDSLKNCCLAHTTDGGQSLHTFWGKSEGLYTTAQCSHICITRNKSMQIFLVVVPRWRRQHFSLVINP